MTAVAAMLGLTMLAGQGAADIGQPPGLPRIGDGFVGTEIGFDPVSQDIKAQKLKINLPPQGFMTYSSSCFDLGGGLFMYLNRFGEVVYDCPYKDKLQEAETMLPPEAWPSGLTAVAGDSWVTSPPGSDLPFGTFTPIRVNAVAFGSIPVSATVHISQTKRDGLIQPFALKWIATMTYVPEGVEIAGYGASPGYPYAFEFPPEFSGQVDIRLSDVVVDGVPVPVGDRCAAPADLTFTPRPGFYDLSAQGVKGEPGEFAPLTAPGYLPGTADIKSFSGCRNGAEVLDPLLTTMISGSGNPIDATMNHQLQPWCEPYDGSEPIGKVNCDINQAPLDGGSAAGLKAMRLDSSLAAGDSHAKPLSARQLAKVRARVAHVDRSAMSKPVRRMWDEVVRALPPSTPSEKP